MLSIVIPAFNHHEMTKECLEAIRENTKDYEIILVDNGSDPPIDGATMRNEKNVGATKAFNQGLEIAKGDYLCLSPNDTIVGPGWAELLLHHLKKYDVIAATGNNLSGPQQVGVPFYKTKKEFYKVAFHISEEKKGKAYPWYRVLPHYLMMPRSIFEKIGFFDERFYQGYFADDDYSFRMLELGMKIGIAEDVYAHHFGSATLGKNGGQWVNDKMREAQKIFENKWPRKEQERLIKLFIEKNKSNGN